MLTAGVAALPEAERAAILAAVRRFDAFNAENDPYGEHDFAVLIVGSDRILFKIETYDRSLTAHSPDSADPFVTVRVLAIMTAEEY